MPAQASLHSAVCDYNAAPVFLFPPLFTCGTQYKFSCRDQATNGWRHASYWLMEAFRQGNFQMASSGYRVCGTGCLVKPLSQGRVSTSCWLGVILLPSPLNLLRLGCMQVSQPRFRVTIILTLSTRPIKCNLLLMAYKIAWFEGVSLRLALSQ